MRRERDRACWLQLIDGNEGLAGLFFFLLSKGKAEKKPKKFEQVLGRAYRKCGEFFFFFGFWPGTGAFFFFLFSCAWGLNLEQVLCGGSTALFFFLGGLNLEQVLGRAYRKCGGSTALFFWGSEPLFSLFPSFPLSFPLFTYFSIFLLSLFSLFLFFFLPFFTSFFPFTTFFTLFPFFSFFPFLFRILFRIFVGLAAAAALPPYLAFPYLTSHYISSPLLP